MDDDLAQKAINAALSGQWQLAVEFNNNIIKNTPQNTEALNRLARAYIELGNITKAKKACQEVVKIDPYNNIAIRTLTRWKNLKPFNIKVNSGKHVLPVQKLSNPQTFLEEPGKTKIASLLFVGSPKVLAKLDPADRVYFDTHSHRVSVIATDKSYIGRLPDDLSARLKNLINMGNTYQVFIKSVNDTEVKVFIRETFRAKKITNTPSFTSEKIDYVSFTPPELVHKKEYVPEEADEEY